MLIYLDGYIKKQLKPFRIYKNTADKGYEEIDNSKRYSSTQKRILKNIYDKYDKLNEDNEHNCLMYCYNNGKKIISVLSVPLVHLFFLLKEKRIKI